MFKKWLAALMLLAVSLPGVAHATLGTGDIAFTAIASRSTVIDQWAFVFLAAPSAGETISFTTDNWSNAGVSFTNAEDTVSWINSSTNYIQPGYVLEVFNAGVKGSPVFKVFNQDGVAISDSQKGSFLYPKVEGSDGEVLGIKKGGDNVLAYEGGFSKTANNAAFLAGIVTKVGWGQTDTGDRPTSLTDGSTSLNFTGTRGYYNTGLRNGGTATQLRAYINSNSRWVSLADSSNTDLPYNESLYQPYGGALVPTPGYHDALSQSFYVNGGGVGATPTWTPVVTATPYAPTGGTSLAAGDVAFVGLAARGSTYADQFAIVILKSGGISTGTKLTFTDDNWLNSNLSPTPTPVNAFVTTENIVKWTSDGNYPAGDVIQFLNSNPYQANVYKNDGSGDLDTVNGNGHGFVSSVDASGNLSAGGSNFGLDKDGDNLFVIQGTVASPTFITGLVYKIYWGTPAPTTGSPTPSSGDLPIGLTPGVNALYLQADPTGTPSPSFGYYNAATYGTLYGYSQVNLLPRINDSSKWTGKVDTTDTDLVVPAQPVSVVW